MHALKDQAKKQGLMDLIKEMHKMMVSGDGDKAMTVEDAVNEAEEDLDLAGKGPAAAASEEAQEHGGDDMSSMVKDYMKRGSKIPVKGKSVVMQAMVSKKPTAHAYGKKMKHG